jgi:predicted esterase
LSDPHYLKVEKTARFYSSGPLNGPYKRICFCLHGYGQLAQYFIRKFQEEALAETLFIAPEGFHRFYLSNSKGRVGASWMTKEDRLNDIEDYIHFLDRVCHEVQQHTGGSLPMGVFGFSQGVATACRWVANSVFTFDYLVNWAGAFPPDLNFEKAHERLQPMRLLLAVGDADEYISEQASREHIAFLKEKGFKPEWLPFEGKHDIYSGPLLQAFELLGLR